MEIPNIFRPKEKQPTSKKPKLSARNPVSNTQSPHTPTLETSGIFGDWFKSEYHNPKK